MLDATGVLQGAATDRSGKALDSLLTTDLGLAARALDKNSANVTQATAASKLGSLSLANLDTSNSSTVKDDILRASLNLSGRSGGLLTDGGLLDAGTSVALPESISTEVATRVLSGLLRQVRTDDVTPAIEFGSVSVIEQARAANDARGSQGLAATPAPAPLAAPADTNPTELPSQANDPAATALNSATGNPAYAEAAAAFYLSAAIYRAQPLPGNVDVPDEFAESPTVTGIQRVPALKARQ